MFEELTPSTYLTKTTSTAVPIPDPSLTTLCDGFPRLLGPDYSYSTFVTTFDEPSTTWVGNSYITPAPDCTINEADCTPYMLDYESSTSAYQTNNSNPYPFHPPCTTYSACPGEGEGMCKMIVNVDTVYYWPVTMTGDFCGDRSTITNPEPTKSTVIAGTTYVSPSVYVIVSQLNPASYAARYKAKDCGHDLTNKVFSMHPTDVSTHWGPLKRNTETFRQLNLADLNTPIPATAYFWLTELPNCQADPETCKSTIRTDYQPYLSAATQSLRGLDPDELAYCDLHPSQHNMLGAPTWIPLEPTPDDWPTPTPTPTVGPQAGTNSPTETGTT